MFTTNSKEKIGLWIPLCPLLCCKLVKCNHSVNNWEPALNNIQDIRKCGIDIGGNLKGSWLCMGGDYRWCEGYPP